MIAVSAAPRRLVVGYLAALGAAFAYGVAALVARKILDDYSSPLVGTAFSMMFGTAIMAVLFHGHALSDSIQAPRRAWLLVALAGCASTWGVTFWFLALNEAPVVLVAPLAGCSPLVTIALAHIFLRRIERLSWRTVMGAALVVAGVAVIAIGRE